MIRLIILTYGLLFSPSLSAASREADVPLSLCTFEVERLSKVIKKVGLPMLDLTSSCLGRNYNFVQAAGDKEKFALVFIGLSHTKTELAIAGGEIIFFKSDWQTPMAVYFSKRARGLIPQFKSLLSKNTNEREPASEAGLTGVCTSCQTNFVTEATAIGQQLNAAALFSSVKNCLFSAMTASGHNLGRQAGQVLKFVQNPGKFISESVKQFSSLFDQLKNLPTHLNSIAQTLKGADPEVISEIGCAAGGLLLPAVLQTALTGGTAGVQIAKITSSIVATLTKLKPLLESFKIAKGAGVSSKSLATLAREGMMCAIR